MPRLSSPLNAKASVRSPYALDRSQQNSCVGTVLAKPGYETRPGAHTCALSLPDNDVFTRMPLKRLSAGKPFSSQCHRSAPPAETAEAAGTCHPQSRAGAWWSQTGSNRRPHACKARALPTELWPPLARRTASARAPIAWGVVRSIGPPEVSHEVWWAQADSNCRPHAYQACALTN